MTNEQAISTLKQLCDGAIKMGLISKTEDAALLHEMFLMIQKSLSEPDTNNHQQLQQVDNYPEVTNGPAETGVRKPTHY